MMLAFQRAGIVRVNSIEELFDCAELLSKQPLPQGPGLAVITNGGGPGVMAADALSAYGIEPAPLSQTDSGKAKRTYFLLSGAATIPLISSGTLLRKDSVGLWKCALRPRKLMH